MKVVRMFSFIVILFLSPYGSGASSETPIDVSIIQLIATPEMFEGKFVSVIGFIHIGQEQDLLFLEEQDFNQAAYQNALWFHLSEEMGRDWQKLNRNFVGVVGVFTARHEGPYGCPNGGFLSVQRYQVDSTPGNPAGKTLDKPAGDGPSVSPHPRGRGR